MNQKLIDRFWAKIPRPSETACWEWQGYVGADGYGQTWNGARVIRTHILSYGLLVGSVPDGLQLDHLFRNRACVNPAHLEPVSSRVNNLRGVGLAAIHFVTTACPQGHPYDEANTYWRKDKYGRECKACRNLRRSKWREEREQHESVPSIEQWGRGDD